MEFTIGGGVCGGNRYLVDDLCQVPLKKKHRHAKPPSKIKNSSDLGHFNWKCLNKYKKCHRIFNFKKKSKCKSSA